MECNCTHVIELAIRRSMSEAIQMDSERNCITINMHA